MVQVKAQEMIVGQGVRLIAPDEGLAKELNKILVDSFEHLKKWMMWATTIPTVEDTSAMLRKHRIQFESGKSFEYILTDLDGNALGRCGVPRLDFSIPSFEVGYWLGSSAQGKGYMTSAVRLLTEYLKSDLHAKRVEICCDENNAASYKVAERAGFELEGVLRCHRRSPSGEISNTRIYSRVFE